METTVARQLFGQARVARLATNGPAGPHLVPICFAVEGNVLYSAVDQKPKSGRPLRRLENVRRDPRVAVLADEYDEDWSRLWWVRADGRARILEAGAERSTALRSLELKYVQYRQEPPGGPVLAVDVERWTFWSAG